MSRLEIMSPTRARIVMEGLYKDLERRIESSPPGLCPVDMARAFLELCHAQTCGKCVPCRIGLGQLNQLIRDVLNGKATMDTLDLMEKTALSIMDSADCAIGYEAANMVYKGLIGYRDDYVEHIRNGRCTCTYNQPVPCVAICPAHVDIPGYVALVEEGRYADAIRLIRKDNPFPTTCGFICEHPCEARCRRNMVDDAVNIRGLKRFAADYAGVVDPPKCAPSTGKKVAVLGGGPGGLSAAYYLQLMGHQTTVYEMLPKLGGMLRYGIPNYRLPKDRLDDDINAILKTGVEVKYGLKIGVDITIQELREQYDAVLITIGASTDKKLGLPGEDADGVLSAVQFLRSVGKDEIIDLTGKEVVVIGGGNVSMDAVRTAKRLGAKKVSILYRRRRNDMTDRDGNNFLYEGICAEARVVSVIRAGIFVDLFGLEVYIPLRELSYQRMLDAQDSFQPGQRILVKILSIDRSDRTRIRVSASIKQAGENPYEKALRRYSVGNRYVGTVSMVDMNGVFVSLDGGIDCLCSYPKRGRPPRGSRVTVRILGINNESNRIWGAITHIATPR